MIDWNASAAWAAFGVAVITPAITSFLNNKHQSQMYELKRKHDRIDHRNAVISSAISGIGVCFANPTLENMSKFGERFHSAYAFVPVDQWPSLNQFFKDMSDGKYDAARESLPSIIMLLASSYTTETKC